MATWGKNDRELLARLIWAESEGEPYNGKLGVGTVIANRMDSPKTGEFSGPTLRGVMYRRSAFSCMWDGRYDKWTGTGTAVQECYAAADEIIRGKRIFGPSCLFFFQIENSGDTGFVNNQLSDPTKKAVKIGSHTFTMDKNETISDITADNATSINGSVGGASSVPIREVTKEVKSIKIKDIRKITNSIFYALIAEDGTTYSISKSILAASNGGSDLFLVMDNAYEKVKDERWEAEVVALEGNVLKLTFSTNAVSKINTARKEINNGANVNTNQSVDNTISQRKSVSVDAWVAMLEDINSSPKGKEKTYDDFEVYADGTIDYIANNGAIDIKLTSDPKANPGFVKWLGQFVSLQLNEDKPKFKVGIGEDGKRTVYPTDTANQNDTVRIELLCVAAPEASDTSEAENKKWCARHGLTSSDQNIALAKTIGAETRAFLREFVGKEVRVAFQVFKDKQTNAYNKVYGIIYVLSRDKKYCLNLNAVMVGTYSASDKRFPLADYIIPPIGKNGKIDTKLDYMSIYAASVELAESQQRISENSTTVTKEIENNIKEFLKEFDLKEVVVDGKKCYVFNTDKDDRMYGVDELSDYGKFLKGKYGEYASKGALQHNKIGCKVDNNNYVPSDDDMDGEVVSIDDRDILDDIDREQFNTLKAAALLNNQQVRDNIFRIGDCTLQISPLSIRVDRKASNRKVPTLRGRNALQVQTGNSTKTISVVLYFSDLEQINGSPYANPVDPEYVYYRNGLRPLIAQFYKAPFLPIENEYLNRQFQIYSVGLEGIDIKTVPGFPNCMQATLRLVDFDHSTYMPQAEFFENTFCWPLYRWYYQQCMYPVLIGENRSYRSNPLYLPKISNISSDIKFHVLDEAVLQKRQEAIQKLNNRIAPSVLEAENKSSALPVIPQGLAEYERWVAAWNKYAPYDTIKCLKDDHGAFKGFTSNDMQAYINVIKKLREKAGKTIGNPSESYAVFKGSGYALDPSSQVFKKLYDSEGFSNDDKKALLKGNLYCLIFRAYAGKNLIYGEKFPAGAKKFDYICIDEWLDGEIEGYVAKLNVVYMPVENSQNRKGRLIYNFSYEGQNTDVEIPVYLKKILADHPKAIKDGHKECTRVSYGASLYVVHYLELDMQNTIVVKKLSDTSHGESGFYAKYNKEIEEMVRLAHETENDIETIEYPIEGLIIESITASMNNKLIPLQVLSNENPTFQYLGGTDNIVNVQMRTTNNSTVMALQNLVSHTQRLAREYRVAINSGILTVEQEVLQMFGLRNMIIENITVDTSQKDVDSFIISMDLVSFDKTQRSKENLNESNLYSLNPETNTDNLESFTRAKRKRKWFDYTHMDFFMRKAEVYPDLVLPTYKEANRAIYKLAIRQHDGTFFTHMPNPQNGKFVDPDFYISTQVTLRDYVENALTNGELAPKLKDTTGTSIIDNPPSSSEQLGLQKMSKPDVEVVTMDKVDTAEEFEYKNDIDPSRYSGTTSAADTAGDAESSLNKPVLLKPQEFKIDALRLKEATKKAIEDFSKDHPKYSKTFDALDVNETIADCANLKGEEGGDKTLDQPGLVQELAARGHQAYLQKHGKGYNVNPILGLTLIILRAAQYPPDEGYHWPFDRDNMSSAIGGVKEQEGLNNGGEATVEQILDYMVGMEIWPGISAEDGNKIFKSILTKYTASKVNTPNALTAAISAGAQINFPNLPASKKLTKEQASEAIKNIIGNRPYIPMGITLEDVKDNGAFEVLIVTEPDKQRELKGMLQGSAHNPEFKKIIYTYVLDYLRYEAEIKGDKTMKNAPYILYIKRSLWDLVSKNKFPVGYKEFGAIDKTEELRGKMNATFHGENLMGDHVEHKEDGGGSPPTVMLKWKLEGTDKTKAMEWVGYYSGIKGEHPDYPSIKPSQYFYFDRVDNMYAAPSNSVEAGMRTEENVGIVSAFTSKSDTGTVEKTIEAVPTMDVYLIADDVGYLYRSAYDDIMRYNHSGRLLRAFPTFQMYIIDEGQDKFYYTLWDNFFEYNSLLSIDIHKDRRMAADTAVIAMTNIYGNLTTIDNDLSYGESDINILDTFSFLAGDFEKTDKAIKAIWNLPDINIIKARNASTDSLYLKPGARIHLRLGYGSNAFALPTVFNGVISEMDTGEVVTICAQGDGIELTNKFRVQNEAATNKNFMGIVVEPRQFICDCLTTRGGIFANLIAAASDGLFYKKNPFGVVHFGNGEVQKQNIMGDMLGFWHDYGEAGLNVYCAAPTRSFSQWIYTEGKQAGNYIGLNLDSWIMPTPQGGDEYNIKVYLYDNTLMDVFQTFAAATPDFIVTVVPFEMRSTLFFGRPWWGVADSMIYRYYYDSQMSTLARESIGFERRALSQIHIYSSYNDILANNIIASSENMKTNIMAKWEERGGAGRTTNLVQMDSDLDDSCQTTGIVSVDIDGSWLDALGDALSRNQRYAENAAIAELRNQAKDMYQGELIVLGDPSIKPYDKVYMEDRHTDMTGMCEVKRVIQSFSLDTGFITQITPDCTAIMDDRQPISIGQWMSAHMKSALGLWTTQALINITWRKGIGVPLQMLAKKIGMKSTTQIASLFATNPQISNVMRRMGAVGTIFSLMLLDQLIQDEETSDTIKTVEYIFSRFIMITEGYQYGTTNAVGKLLNDKIWGPAVRFASASEVSEFVKKFPGVEWLRNKENFKKIFNKETLQVIKDMFDKNVNTIQAVNKTMANLHTKLLPTRTKMASSNINKGVDKVSKNISTDIMKDIEKVHGQYIDDTIVERIKAETGTKYGTPDEIRAALKKIDKTTGTSELETLVKKHEKAIISEIIKDPSKADLVPSLTKLKETPKSVDDIFAAMKKKNIIAKDIIDNLGEDAIKKTIQESIEKGTKTALKEATEIGLTEIGEAGIKKLVINEIANDTAKVFGKTLLKSAGKWAGKTLGKLAGTATLAGLRGTMYLVGGTGGGVVGIAAAVAIDVISSCIFGNLFDAYGRMKRNRQAIIIVPLLYRNKAFIAGLKGHKGMVYGDQASSADKFWEGRGALGPIISCLNFFAGDGMGYDNSGDIPGYRQTSDKLNDIFKD